MPEVLIHHCSLRVVRRGGWNWGPDPKRLVQEVVRGFPDLLAHSLSQLLPEDEDREFAAPVRIRIPIRMSELSAEVTVGSHGQIGTAPPAVLLEQKLDSALSAAFGLDQEPARNATPRDRFAGVPPEAAEGFPGATLRKGGALQGLLRGWHKEGELERRLAALSREQISAWHDALRRSSAGSDMAFEQPDPGLSERIDTYMRTRVRSLVADDVTDRLRTRILIATEAAEQVRISLSHFLLWRVLDLILPVENASSRSIASSTKDGASAVRIAELPGLLAPSSEIKPSVASEPNLLLYAVHTQSAEWEVKIACSLPFLLLGPLSRLGYFAALAAVLEAAKLTDESSLFAAALAYKVLDPPHRGWQRSPASVLAAAAFAGSREAIREESLVDFSRQIAPHMGALDLVLADRLIAGHIPGEPLFLGRKDLGSETSLFLVDTPGCFPLACARGLESLLPIVQRMGTPVLLVSRDAADHRLLGDLDAAGITFVIDVPPTRNERWQRIQQGSSPLGWTNSRQSALMPVLQAARGLAAVSGEAEGLWRNLVVDRPSVVRADSPDLDLSLTLAAAVGMGMVSWKLWRDKGPTSPRLTLERYCDLDGRIRFNPVSVNVSLPLGRRYQELREAGLLASISDIPWLGGRRIEFGGG